MRGFIIRTLRHPLSFQIRADLFSGLATMEKAGLPVAQALVVLHLPGKAQLRLAQMRKLIMRGVDIASAGAASALFTPFEVSVVRAAVEAGSPASTYRRLADRYCQQAQQRATLKSRMSLPIFVLIIALCVQPLPNLVAGAITGGAYVWQVVRPLALLAGLVGLMVWFESWLEQAPATPVIPWLAQQMTQLPLFGALHKRRVNHEFFVSMALLLDAGIPIFDALPHAVDTIRNGVIREDFSRLKRRMMQGASFAQAVEKLHYLGNDQVIGFIQTGEESGTLPAMLERFVDAENDAINRIQEELLTWLPRAIYTLLALWMAYGILSSSAFMPNLPSALR